MPKQNSNSYDFNSRSLDQKGLRDREAFLDAAATGDEEKLKAFPPEDQRKFANYRDPRPSHSRRTALIYASQNGHDGVIRHLLGLGADPDIKDTDGWAALTVAVANNRRGIVEILLDGKADINTQDNGLWTPLMEAINRGSEDIALLLIQRGADLRLRNEEGMTALDLAQDFQLQKTINTLAPILQKLDTADSVRVMRTGTARKVSAPSPARFRKAG